MIFQPMAIDWSSDLNPSQLEATFHGTGPLLVVSGPGTGKTRVLSYRIGRLMESGIARADRILAVTFTKQAAKEISERVSRLLYGESTIECRGNRRTTPGVNTFHGWALGFLKRTLGEETRLLIDEKDAWELCRETAGKLGLQGAKTQRLYISISEAKQYYPPRIHVDTDWSALYKAYHDLLNRYGLWDYDDLLLEALRLLQGPEVSAEFHRDVPFILVDEFQDISPVQYALIKAMTKKDGNITVIGDPNQSIYGFRGASPRFIHRFKEDYDNVKTVTLDTSYRCPQVFLDAASGIIRDKSAIHLKSSGDKTSEIKIRIFSGPEAEAKWVARTIEQIVGGLSFDSLNRGAARGNVLRSLSDVAVLYRINALGNPIAKALSIQGVPFQRADTPNPLTHKGLRSVWRLWEALKGRAVNYHITRLPGHEDLWNERLAYLRSEQGGKNGPQLIGSIIEILNLDPNEPSIRVLVRAVERQPEVDSLAVLLRNEADMLDIDIEAVSLLSMHAAKGLEFPVVFMIGCEAGILPWKKSDPDEERRLFYVGLTRASEEIYLSHVKRRRLFGKVMEKGPSPIIGDIPERFLVRVKAQKPLAARRPRQKRLF